MVEGGLQLMDTLVVDQDELDEVGLVQLRVPQSSHLFIEPTYAFGSVERQPACTLNCSVHLVPKAQRDERCHIRVWHGLWPGIMHVGAMVLLQGI